MTIINFDYSEVLAIVTREYGGVEMFPVAAEKVLFDPLSDRFLRRYYANNRLMSELVYEVEITEEEYDIALERRRREIH